MVQSARWLEGYVCFSIKECCKGAAARFLNLSSRAEIPLWNMKKESEGFVACTNVESYEDLRPIARKCRVKIHITNKKGMPFIRRRCAKRKGMVYGGILFIAVLWLLSGYVWNVSVSGNTNLSSEMILQVAKQAGLAPGTPKNSFDPQAMAREIMLRIPEIGWVSVNTEGCSAVIQLQEKVQKPEAKQKQESVNNIVADYDGQILSIDVFDGTGMVKAGDAVTKGQLLISGISEDSFGEPIVKNARGKVVAHTKREFDVKVPMCRMNAKPTGKVVYRCSLKIFGARLPLTFIEKPKGSYREEIFTNPVILLGKKLPIHTYTEKWTEYKKEMQNLTEQQADEEARKILLHKVKESINQNGSVIGTQISAKVQGEDYVLHAKCDCMEEIGREQEILFK